MASDLELDEHQCKLADDCIEAGVGERHCLGPAHLPLDILPLSACNRQHLFIRIDPHDMPVRSYPLGRSTSQHASTAANIKHAVSRADSRCVRNAWTPLGEEGRDKQLVIDHRWVSLGCVFPVDVHLLSPMVIKTLLVFATR